MIWRSELDHEPPELRITLLGEIAAYRYGRPVQMSSPSLRRLMARLALQPGSAIAKVALIDLLWPTNPPATAASSLQNQIHRLRRALGVDVVVTRGSGYALEVDPIEVDIHRFERLLDGSGDLSEALMIWAGPALMEFADEDWARPIATRLLERFAGGRERQIEWHLAGGSFGTAIAEAEALCIEEPLRERAHGLLMEALACDGRASEALVIFHGFRKRLVHQTGLEPSGALVGVEHRILEGSVGARSPAEKGFGRGQLPAEVNALVGRECEIAELEAMLAGSRLLTLTGPGGVGKSRLAHRVAALRKDGYLNGVGVVDLSNIVDGDAVAAEVAGRVGAGVGMGSPLDSVVAKLATQHRLVLLDSCEHVLAGAAELVGAIVRSCPKVTVIATSREPLGLSGERVFVVEPLGPMAVELFEVRAREARRGFTVTASLRPLVAEICAGVDGLPLAVELAAARCDHLTVGEIRAQLEHRFDLLAGGPRDAPARHRGLARVIDWSWDLLSGPESLLLTRLSVFRGGCTGDAATAVCAFDGINEMEVRSLLGCLVRKSLLVAELDGEQARYRLLDSIRAYASERCAVDQNAIALLERRHAEWAFGVLTRIARLLSSIQEPEGAAWRDRELANLNAGLDWAYDHGGVDHVLRWIRVICSPGFGASQLRPLRRAWMFVDEPPWTADHPDGGYMQLHHLHEVGAKDPEAATALALKIAERPDLPLSVRVDALTFCCSLAFFWKHDASECLRMARPLVGTSDDPTLRSSLAIAEAALCPSGSAQQGVWLEEALNQARRTGVLTLIGLARYTAGAQRAISGCPDDEAVRLLREARNDFETAGNSFHVSFTDVVLEMIRPGSSSFATIADLMRRGRDQGPIWFLQSGFSVAEILSTHARPEAAAVLIGALGAARDRGTTVLQMGDTPLADKAAENHPEAVSRGRLLTPDEAHAFMVQELDALVAFGVGER
jgi:predicted ATPase/DNA-binding SARP family transcriptional activator